MYDYDNMMFADVVEFRESNPNYSIDGKMVIQPPSVPVQVHGDSTSPFEMVIKLFGIVLIFIFLGIIIYKIVSHIVKKIKEKNS